jgi:cytochrome P450
MKTTTRQAPPGILTNPDCRAVRELARTGNFYVFIKDMGREFGDVVSLSPELFLFAPSRLIKDALRNVSDYRKADSIDTFKILVGEGLFTAQGEIYDQQERVIKSAFGKKYFAEFRTIIERDVEHFIDERLTGARGGEPVDVGVLSVDMTMSIAARAFFGIGGETELARKFREGLVYVQDWFARLQAADFAEPMLRFIEDQYVRLPVLKSLQRTIVRKLSGSGEMVKAISGWKDYVSGNEAKARAIAAEMRGICARIIELRRRDASFADKNDVLSSLLRFQGDPGNKWLTDQVVIDQVATFFVAGHETTSDLFVTLLWKHARGETPRAVVEELEKAGDMIHEEQFLFQKYPRTNDYLTQVMLEHPPIVLTVRQANRDLEVDGYFIAKDTRIVLSITSAQDMDVAFGFGRRQCIGRVFALEEAVIGLRHLIRHKLELADPAQMPEMTQGLTIGYSRSQVPILVKAVGA